MSSGSTFPRTGIWLVSVVTALIMRGIIPFFRITLSGGFLVIGVVAIHRCWYWSR
ncbi:hypothetical protein V8F20_002144 [Naviculisporaceae sp. PSN 640]